MTPAHQVVPAGTRLWRIHPATQGAEEIGEQAAMSAYRTTALAEWLSAHADLAPEAALAQMMLSSVSTERELVLVRLLDGRDLGAAGLADLDVTELPGVASTLLRRRVPDAMGMVWTANHDLPHPTMMLFGPSSAGPLLRAGSSGLRLDTPAGVELLNRELAAHGFAMAMPKTDPPLVFINYRSSDDKLAVDLIDKQLSARFGPAAIFRDDRSLVAGIEFEWELVRKARGCTVLITVVGERWETGHDATGRRLVDRDEDWVRREIAEALRHNVYIVPVLVGTRPKLDPATLPADIAALASRQYLHLPHRFAPEDVQRLIDRLIREVPALASAL